MLQIDKENYRQLRIAVSESYRTWWCELLSSLKDRPVEEFKVDDIRACWERLEDMVFGPHKIYHNIYHGINREEKPVEEFKVGDEVEVQLNKNWMNATHGYRIPKDEEMEWYSGKIECVRENYGLYIIKFSEGHCAVGADSLRKPAKVVPIELRGGDMPTKATALVRDGNIIAVTLTNSGSGYSTPHPNATTFEPDLPATAASIGAQLPPIGENTPEQRAAAEKLAEECGKAYVYGEEKNETVTTRGIKEQLKKYGLKPDPHMPINDDPLGSGYAFRLIAAYCGRPEFLSPRSPAFCFSILCGCKTWEEAKSFTSTLSTDEGLGLLKYQTQFYDAQETPQWNKIRDAADEMHARVLDLVGGGVPFYDVETMRYRLRISADAYKSARDGK